MRKITYRDEDGNEVGFGGAAPPTPPPLRQGGYARGGDALALRLQRQMKS